VAATISGQSLGKAGGNCERSCRGKEGWGEKVWQRRGEEAEAGGRTVQKCMYIDVKMFLCGSDLVTFSG